MAGLRVPPGRAGRLWLRRRLGIAVRGSDLLERKLRVLRAEQQRLRARADVAHQRWRDCVAEAETWLLRADLVGGAASLASLVRPPPANVTITWATTMGVHHPEGGTCTMPQSLAIPASTALVQARDAHQQAAVAAVQHATAQAAMTRLSTEVTTTAQRVRALRHRWIPRLEAALRQVEFDLEELERAESVRRLRATGPAGRQR